MRSAVLATLVLAACQGAAAAPPPAPAPRQVPMPPAPLTLAQSGIVPQWMDRAADPCTDFFQYACGGFVKTAQIPADRSSWGVNEIIQQDTEEFLRTVLEAAVKAPAGKDPVTDQLGAYYAACMDEGAVDKAGIAPIQPLLDRIAKVTDGASAASAVTALAADGVDAFFALGPAQDFADATQMIASLDQAGIGLPERKYYLDSSGTLPKTREIYKAHQERMFRLLGQQPAQAKQSAADAYRIELALAKLQQDDVTRRSPRAIYHRIDRAGLEKIAPAFPWGDYLAGLGIPKVTAITVHDPAYYTAVAKLIASEKPDALRAYLTWILLDASASDLGHPWVSEDFVMQKELRGLEQIPPRWRRCVQHVDSDLGELLAQPYVREKLPGDGRTRAAELGKEILAAMRTELDTLAWMDDTTRAAAKAKLDKMVALVGYPDKWRTYAFPVVRTDYAGNRRAATRFELARQLAKIGKPVDHEEWMITPPTVNAFYDSSLNRLVVAAGELQPPFFGAKFHPAVNFGSAGGGTFGHEMTHGFDDEGSQFDAYGNLKEWWTPATTKKFAEATKCIADQYSSYEAVPKVHLDGKLTAGENIADNGGVKLGYLAYQAWRKRQPHPVQADIEGITDDQLYFLAYGQSWCEKATDKSLETQAHSNPHSPAKWRVNGVIPNQPGFGPAFKCAVGKPMNPGPAKACSIW